MTIRTLLTASLGALALATSCTSADSAARAPQAGTTASSAAASSPTSGAASASADSVSARADRGRIRGAESATVWLVEVSDFQCPYCKQWHDKTYPQIVRDYVNTGKIRIAYLNYPLNIHPNAVPAAEAAMCASVQGKFWEMHDVLFESQERWARLANPAAFYDSLATQLALDLPQWRDCTSKHLTRALIDVDTERSKRQGVQSTPSFFIGDQAIAGAEEYPVFRDAIERALARAGTKPPAR